MRRHLTAAALAAFAGHACRYCGEELPDCRPCDAVAFLRSHPDVVSGKLAALPEAALAACADEEIPEVLERRWLAEDCEELIAHNLVRSLDWEGDAEQLEERFDQLTRESFACPENRFSPGCNAAPVEYDIVGRPEFELEGLPAVAMLLPTKLLASLDPAALAQDLPDLIEGAVFDTDDCTHAEWVFGEASCTAFMVGPRHVMTARHCLGDAPVACGGEASNRIDDQVLIFDYMDHPDDGVRVEGMTVVACGNAAGGTTVADEDDWALIELDAPPPGSRVPFQLPSSDAGASECEPVSIIGHPLGHAQYRSGTVEADQPDAWVRRPPGDFAGSFHTTVDVVPGFSGAPVISGRDDARLLGIVVSGRFERRGEGCDWIFQCRLGCETFADYGAAVDLAAIADVLAPLVDP